MSKSNHEKPHEEPKHEEKKMTKKEAQEIVDHYLKVSYTGMPKDLAEAQKVLQG